MRRSVPSGPREEDFAELANATTKWFEQSVIADLPAGVTLVQTRSSVEKAEFGEGVDPDDPQFNVLLLFEFVEFVFLSFVDALEDVPIASELNEAMIDSINEEYITLVVQTIPAFAGVTEVFAKGSIDNTFQPLPTTTPAPVPTVSPTLTFSPAPSFSVAPSSSMIEDQQVQVGNFFIAYTVPGGSEPSDTDFALLIQTTAAWFAEVITSQLPAGVSLLGTDPESAESLFDGSAPASQPNVYTEYSYIVFSYIVSGDNEPPSPEETLRIMRESVLDAAYIQTIRQIEAFANAEAALLLSLDGTPTPSPSPSSLVPSLIASSYIPSMGAPSIYPSTGLANGGEVVMVEPFYIAFASVKDPLVEPTQQEFLQIMETTVTWWETGLSMALPADTFLRAEAVLDSTSFQADFPSERFNLLLRFDVNLFFATVPTGLSTPEEVYDRLKDLITADYIVTAILPLLPGSAFAKVTEVIMIKEDTSP